MTLSSDQFVELRRALAVWAEGAPNEPVLGFLQGSEMLTPRELVEAVGDPQNEDGVAFLEMLEHAVHRDGIESVTNRFYRSQLRPEHG